MSVQSALRGVRPDDLDAIFDGALFGPPTLEEAIAEEAAGTPEGASPVPVGAVDWYVERGAQPAGPYRLERLRELWHQGVLGPDTLFWCEAWTGWRPLSHVPELVAALTISGLPTVAADASVKASSESKPRVRMSVVLPSLVAQEEEWLRKREQEKEEKLSALLDAPGAPIPASAVPAHLAPLPDVPVSPPVPPVVAPAAAPGLLGPLPPLQGVPAAPYPGPGVPVAPPAVPGMMAVPVPVEAPASSRRGKLLLVGAVMGSAALGLAVGALLLLPRVQSAPASAPEPEAAPRPVASAPVVSAPVVPAPVAVAPVVQQAPAPEVPVAPVVPPPAPAAPVVQVQPTAPVKPEKPEVKPEPKVVPVAVQTVPAPVVEKPKKVAVAVARPEPQPPPAPVAPVSPPGHKVLADDKRADDPTNFDDSLDKDFEKELGFAKDSPKHTPDDPRSKRTVYLPPEPGKVSDKDLPESLSTSDIVQVVSSHKDAILSCIEAHDPPRTSDSGKDRFVLRWRVQPAGTATDVLMETEALKGTPFARCMEGQVRSWKFPRHRVESREPVRFPFTY